jgi:archaellum component FlaC
MDEIEGLRAEVERLQRLVETVDRQRISNGEEVEQLRESNQIWAEVANDLVEFIGRDKVQALVHVKGYVERLRGALKNIDEGVANRDEAWLIAHQALAGVRDATRSEV